MRKVLLLGLCLSAWAAVSSVASAGLTSILLESRAGDDTLTDNSLGFIYDADGDDAIGQGDEVFGIARVDFINDNPASQGFVYIVYSLAFDTPADSSDPTKGWSYAANAGRYSLANLLGVSVGSGSLAAVIEFDGSGTNPFTNTTNYNFSSGFLSSPSGFAGDLTTLMANSTLQFAVGLLDQDGNLPADDYFTSGLIKAIGTEWKMEFEARMSLTDTGAIGPVGWASLVLDPNYDSLISGGFQYLQSLSYGTSGDMNGYIATRDVGDYRVHYTPEPSAFVALLGLGLAGVAVSVVRRRARKS